MTLVEFLILLLSTHSQVLQRLAAFFGEEELLELLERASDVLETTQPTTAEAPFPYEKSWFIPAPLQLAKTSPYLELEGTVREFNLPSVLEFHLWTYPFYRTLIESPLDLKMTFHPDQPGGQIVVRDAMTQAKTWINQLPVHPVLAEQVRTLGMAPWLRFQNEVLKKLGGRPFTSI